MDNAASIPPLNGRLDEASDQDIPDLSAVQIANTAQVATSPPPCDAAGDSSGDDSAAGASASDDLRAAPRFTLLIRAAKLIAPNGEFVCVIRDVSESGVSVRMFHRVPDGEQIELHMPAGGQYALKPVWRRDREAGFEFGERVDVAQLIHEVGEYPKRGMRLGLCFPIALHTLAGRAEGVVENLSQQGARFTSDAMFAIDQTIRIAVEDDCVPFPEVRAKIRWRREHEYGVVFDDTLSLEDFALLAARLQSPGLVG